MNIDVTALKAVEREKGIPADTVHRGDRVGPRDRLPARRRRGQARARARRPQERRGRRAGAGARTRRRRRPRVGRHPVRLRPDRGQHRQAGHRAAAARRRARADLRRVRRQGGRHRQRHRAGARPPQRAGHGAHRHRQGRGGAAAGRAGARRGATPTAAGSRPTSCRSPAPSAARRSPSPAPTRNLVRKLFALEVPEIADGSVEIVAVAREAGHRSKIAVRTQGARAQRQGRLHRPDGPAGAQRHERAARREDRHRRLGRRPGDVRGLGAEPGAGRPAPRSSTRRRRPCASSSPTTSCRWRSARKGRTPGWPRGSPAAGSTSAATRRPTTRPRPPRRGWAARRCGRALPAPRPGDARAVRRAHRPPHPDARNIPAPPRARVQGGRNVDPGPHLCGVPDARSGQRSAACRRPVRGSGPRSAAAAPRQGGIGAPHPGVPARSGATPGLRPGAAPPRRRRCPAGGRSAPGPRPRRLLGGCPGRGAGAGENATAVPQSDRHQAGPHVDRTPSDESAVKFPR